MGVTHHDARGRARRDGEPGLEDDVPADRETQRFFGYHAGHENTGRGLPRPTPVLTCFRTRRRIGAYLDGALEADAAASAARHLAECASCRREAEDLRRMKALLQRVLSPETVSASPDWTAFWPGILRGIEAGRRAPAAKLHTGWRRARWALGGALVVALVIGATLSQWQAPRQEPRQEQTQTAASPVLEKPVLVSTTAGEDTLPLGTAVEDPVLISSADTEHPDGSVMIYHTPERDMSVVWVFGVNE